MWTLLVDGTPDKEESFGVFSLGLALWAVFALATSYLGGLWPCSLLFDLSPQPTPFFFSSFPMSHVSCLCLCLYLVWSSFLFFVFSLTLSWSWAVRTHISLAFGLPWPLSCRGPVLPYHDALFCFFGLSSCLAVAVLLC